jgi:hypothetical protein
MRNKTLKSVALMGLLVVLSAAIANAQSARRIEASIPFDFTAGETKLKAGDYTVKQISRDSLLLRSADEKTSIVIVAPIAIQSMRQDAPERLVFNRYGSEYFLSQAWTNRAADGRQLNPSRAESEIAKHLAKTKNRQEAVAVIARAR